MGGAIALGGPLFLILFSFSSLSLSSHLISELVSFSQRSSAVVTGRQVESLSRVRFPGFLTGTWESNRIATNIAFVIGGVGLGSFALSHGF